MFIESVFETSSVHFQDKFDPFSRQVWYVFKTFPTSQRDTSWLTLKPFPRNLCRRRLDHRVWPVGRHAIVVLQTRSNLLVKLVERLEQQVGI